jgi:Phosphotransacetylase
VPDLEAGNMLAKNLTFLAKADSAGIVLGARVPIVLTSSRRFGTFAPGVLRCRCSLRPRAPQDGGIARGVIANGYEWGIASVSDLLVIVFPSEERPSRVAASCYRWKRKT